MTRGFRLAAVERMRGRRLEDAGRELARVRQALVEATARRDLLAGQLSTCRPAGRATPEEFTAAARHREQLRERLHRADAELAELTAAALSARDCWLSARGDLRAAEALHERYRLAVRTERDRHEQRLADELAAARHRGLRLDPAVDSAAEEPAGEPVAAGLPVPQLRGPSGRQAFPGQTIPGQTIPGQASTGGGEGT